MIKRQRNLTRTRIDQFRDIWTRRSSARGTISPFEFDVEAAIGTGVEPAAPSAIIAVRTGELMLQVLVETLTERNAVLQREMEMISSAAVSGLERAQLSGGVSEEPPPVYVESAESGQQPPTRSRPRKPR
ncbi:hypothetical protein C8R44DRAFT_774402 [Mycena epipterygia]|nr:hypothetical protein C8R44DRAFT_774402 [Mycena epipterygia]